MRALLLFPLLAAPLAAQVAARSVPAAPACREVPFLGLSLAVRSDSTSRDVFLVEPIVAAVDPAGRTTGRVQPKDRIVAVDGQLITTAAGSRRLRTPSPTSTIQLAIRRDGKLLQVAVPPSGCMARYLTFTPSVRWTTQPAPAASRAGFEERTLLDSVAPRKRFPADTGRLAVLPNGDTVRVIDASTLMRGGRGAAVPTSRVRELALDSVRVDALPADSSARRWKMEDLPVDRLSDLIKVRDSSARFMRGTASGGVEVYDVKGQRVDRIEERVVVGASATGWLGFGLDCRDCASRMHNGVRIWQFRSPPVVAGIEPGSPAELAGIRIGDVLRSIDRAPLESSAGATRFSTLRAGEQVRLQLERNGAVRDVLITATRRPGAS